MLRCALPSLDHESLSPHLFNPHRSGEFTTESNQAFDTSLRERDPSWGYRDVEDLKRLAADAGLRFRDQISMPANNFLMLFDKRL